jgi:hypothetical protein
MLSSLQTTYVFIPQHALKKERKFKIRTVTLFFLWQRPDEHLGGWSISRLFQQRVLHSYASSPLIVDKVEDYCLYETESCRRDPV